MRVPGKEQRAAQPTIMWSCSNTMKRSISISSSSRLRPTSTPSASSGSINYRIPLTSSIPAERRACNGLRKIMLPIPLWVNNSCNTEHTVQSTWRLIRWTRATRPCRPELRMANITEYLQKVWQCYLHVSKATLYLKPRSVHAEMYLICLWIFPLYQVFPSKNDLLRFEGNCHFNHDIFGCQSKNFTGWGVP